MSLVKTQNTLRTDEKKTKIKNLIVSRAKEFENLSSYKLNNEFLSLVCNQVENLVKKHYKIDKKSFVLEFFSALFPDITTDEQLQIANNIAFIFDNNLIIKIPLSKQIVEFGKNWLKKKDNRVSKNLIDIITSPMKEVINNKKKELVISILIGLKIAPYIIGIIIVFI